MSQLPPVLRCAVPTLHLMTLVLYGFRFFGVADRHARLARPEFCAVLLLHALFLATFIGVHRRIRVSSYMKEAAELRASWGNG